MRHVPAFFAILVAIVTVILLGPLWGLALGLACFAAGIALHIRRELRGLRRQFDHLQRNIPLQVHEQISQRIEALEQALHTTQQRNGDDDVTEPQRTVGPTPKTTINDEIPHRSDDTPSHVINDAAVSLTPHQAQQLRDMLQTLIGQKETNVHNSEQLDKLAHQLASIFAHDVRAVAALAQRSAAQSEGNVKPPVNMVMHALPTPPAESTQQRWSSNVTRETPKRRNGSTG